MKERSNAFATLTDQTLSKSFELGRRFRAARLRRSWDLEKAEQVTGVSKTTIKKIEKGDPSVGWGFYLSLLQVYGMISELDGLCHPSKDILAPTPQAFIHTKTMKVSFDEDL